MARQRETAELQRLISEGPRRWQRLPGQSNEVVNALYPNCNSETLARIAARSLVWERSISEG
jgi:hypothetical protein